MKRNEIIEVYKKVIKDGESMINKSYDETGLSIIYEDTKALGADIEKYIRSAFIKNGIYGYHDSTYNSIMPDWIAQIKYFTTEIKSHLHIDSKRNTYCIDRYGSKIDSDYYLHKTFNLLCINYEIILKEEYINLNKDELFKLSFIKNIYELKITDFHMVFNCKYFYFDGKHTIYENKKMNNDLGLSENLKNNYVHIYY